MNAPHPRQLSLQRQLITILLLITIPLCLLLIVNNLYAVNAFNGKIADSNQRMVEQWIDKIQLELEAVEESIMTIVAGDSDFLILSGGGASPLQAHLSSLALFNQLRVVLPAYSTVDAFFVYSAPSGVERDVFSPGYSYDEKAAIQAFVRESVAHNVISYSMDWRHAQVDGNHYLFRFFGGRSTYIVAMVPLGNLYRDEGLHMEAAATTVFSTQYGVPLTQRELIEENGIRLEGDTSGYFFSGKPRHMVIGRDIAGTDIRMIILINKAGYLDALNAIQRVLLYASFFTLGFIPVGITWLRRSVIRPLDGIRAVMARIREGDLAAQAPTDGQVREFRQVNETFNSMMEQIRTLKIESYEQEIETQKAELRYLQLQIRPHFFLNCLKSIYAFAQQKQYDKLQQMILAFSRHIRYIFQDNMDFVPLGKELEHIRNYVEIQSISAVHPPRCDVEVDPALLDLPIPPLSIQTFVENSVKHETDPDRGLEIAVKVARVQAGEEACVEITVSDNGDGFAEEVLKEINQADGSVYAQHHVGLNNVKKRMKLIYGEEVLFAFYNSGRGSVSEIVIPLKENAN